MKTVALVSHRFAADFGTLCPVRTRQQIEVIHGVDLTTVGRLTFDNNTVDGELKLFCTVLMRKNAASFHVSIALF